MYLESLIINNITVIHPLHYLIIFLNFQLKLELIEKFHTKPNGAHCSGNVTAMRIGYEYYWDEMKWDVHRYFINCSICVVDGIAVKTNTPVKTAEV